MVEMKPMSEILGKKASAASKHVMDTVPEFRLKTRLKEILYNRKMSQADLSRLTGIPPNQISAFVTNKPTARLSYHHIQVLMIALRLTRIEQLLYVEMPEETVQLFNLEAENWDAYKREPITVQKLYEDSVRITEEENENHKNS